MVNEIYLSLQGESTYAGIPCIFVRLTGCDLRCSYCDTAFAFLEGRRQTLVEIHSKIDELAKPFNQADHPRRWPLVELTGGEPLLQKNSLRLMKTLCDDQFTVLLETSGAHDISRVDARVHRIVDLKCPSTGEVERNRWENMPHLRAGDELKFVIATKEDYAWATDQIHHHNLMTICPLLFSWASPLTPGQLNPSLRKIPTGQRPISRTELAERILADALPVRFQVQMHKVIWAPDARGV